MSRRILPPSAERDLVQATERIDVLERQLPEPTPAPIVSGGGGGGGGSCTHIWGGPAWVENWDQAFGAWRGAAGIEVDIPADGQIQVTTMLMVEPGSGAYTSCSLGPWFGHIDPYSYSLGPLSRGVPGQAIPHTWVSDIWPGTHTLGFVVRLTPNTEPEPSILLPISIIWSECGFGSNVEYPPL